MTRKHSKTFRESDLVLVSRAGPVRAWAVGETAMLASGGPPMVVTGVDGLTVECQWMVDGHACQDAFPAACLAVDESHPDAGAEA